MKRLLKLANLVDDVMTRIAIHAGLCLLTILAISGYVYVQWGIAPPSLDLGLFLTGWQTYLFIPLPLAWGGAKAVKWGLAVRNWWVHTEEKKLQVAVRDLLNWRFSYKRG